MITYSTVEVLRYELDGMLYEPSLRRVQRTIYEYAKCTTDMLLRSL